MPGTKKPLPQKFTPPAHPLLTSTQAACSLDIIRVLACGLKYELESGKELGTRRHSVAGDLHQNFIIIV